MKDLQLLPFRFDVALLAAELSARPDLWNDFDLRTNHPLSPHRELDDIFVRYNARENFRGDRHEFNDRHDAVWWPAINALPSVKPIAFDLMRLVEGTQLGMVLITRIPARKTCYPHTDHGWHAQHYDKFAVQIESTPAQAFHVEGSQALSAEPGQCYLFDNSKIHWVTNESDEDRITMIICIRRA